MTAADATEPLLEISRLAVSFKQRGEQVAAVVDCSLAVARGQRVGLIGESGSGKSVTASAVMGLLDPAVARVHDGSSIRFDGRELLGLSQQELRRLRGSELSMVFQSPMRALNPVFRIGDQLVAVLRAHRSIAKHDARAVAIEALRSVEVAAPERVIDAYPHQLSGGMQQRVLIGMALLGEPRLIIADEPTSALDVTVQAGVMALLRRLAIERQMGVLLITHDMGVVARFCETVFVMYSGRVVEHGPTAEIIGRPRHPYTAGLLRSTPRITGGAGRRLEAIPGGQALRGRDADGCAFAPRCPHARDICRQRTPELRATGAPGGAAAACHRFEELALDPRPTSTAGEVA